MLKKVVLHSVATALASMVCKERRRRGREGGRKQGEERDREERGAGRDRTARRRVRWGEGRWRSVMAEWLGYLGGGEKRGKARIQDEACMAATFHFARAWQANGKERYCEDSYRIHKTLPAAPVVLCLATLPGGRTLLQSLKCSSSLTLPVPVCLPVHESTSPCSCLCAYQSMRVPHLARACVPANP